jgi:hypothetical protein
VCGRGRQPDGDRGCKQAKGVPPPLQWSGRVHPRRGRAGRERHYLKVISQFRFPKDSIELVAFV